MGRADVVTIGSLLTDGCKGGVGVEDVLDGTEERTEEWETDEEECLCLVRIPSSSIASSPLVGLLFADSCVGLFNAVAAIWVVTFAISAPCSTL
jgi:hypothetical protein